MGYLYVYVSLYVSLTFNTGMLDQKKNSKATQRRSETRRRVGPRCQPLAVAASQEGKEKGGEAIGTGLAWLVLEL